MFPAMLIAALLGGGVGSAPGLEFQKAGVKIGRATKFNFTGTAVGTCSQTGTVATCALTAGSGGGNYVGVTLAFSASGGSAATVVTGQAWVTSSSFIVCSPFNDGAVTNNTDEVYAVAEFSWVVSTRVAGTGFTLSVTSPKGVSGNFIFHCAGA